MATINEIETARSAAAGAAAEKAAEGEKYAAALAETKALSRKRLARAARHVQMQCRDGVQTRLAWATFSLYAHLSGRRRLEEALVLRWWQHACAVLDGEVRAGNGTLQSNEGGATAAA